MPTSVDPPHKRERPAFPIRFDPSSRVHRLYFGVYGREPFSLDCYRVRFVGVDV